MKALKCKPRRNSLTAIVSINILSKYSSLISHRCSKVDTSTIDLRWSTHQSPIFKGRHIGLRRSTHPSPKVDSSIFESRHIHLRRSTHRDIDLRRATHRYSKVNTSIFGSRRFDLRRSKAETSHLQFVVEYRPQMRS